MRLGIPEEQSLGVRLDGSGDVQRFDNPFTFVSNSDSIIDVDSPLFPEPQFTLWDEDPFGQEGYFVDIGDGFHMMQAGTADVLGLVQRPLNQETIITALGETVLDGLIHSWTVTGPFGNVTPQSGVFRITSADVQTPPPLPVPTSLWLFAIGLFGLGLNRRNLRISLTGR